MGCSFSTLISANDDEYLFQGVSLFGAENKQLDTSKFQDSNYIDEGQYLWNAKVNGVDKGELLFLLKLNAHKNKTDICLSLEQIKKLGIFLETKSDSNHVSCIFTQDISPFIQYEIKQDVQQITFTIPDALIQHDNDSEKEYNLGNNSVFTNYNYNYSRSEQKEYDFLSEQHFLGLQSGVNIFGWSLRHQSVLSIQDNVSKFESNQFTLYKDITEILPHTRMSLGHVSVAGPNSVPLMGIQLETEPLMRPEGERYYAPVIEQIANSHALVKVLQNGRIIFEKSVTPGPFTIDNLRGLNRQGDLTLEIYEANQTVRSYIIPYAMQLSLIRQNQLNYSLAIGDFTIQNRTTGKRVIQGMYEYGLRHDMSITHGFSYADGYKSTNIGSIFNNKFGGFATNLDYAQSEILKEKGYKFQINYQTQEILQGLNLNLRTAYYSPFFPDLSTSLSTGSQLSEEKISQNMKQDFQLNLTQSFPDQGGNLTFGTLVRSYWNTEEQYKQAQISYANVWKKLQYTLQYNYSKNTKSIDEQTFFISLSLPLGTGKVSANIQQQENTEKSTKSTLQYSDVIGQHNQWNYALSTNYSQDTDQYSQNYSASLSYSGAKNQLSSAISQSKTDRQTSVSLNGALVAHRYGITLSNTLSDTFAIGHIEVENSGLESKKWGQGFDRWGNTIYANLSPYDNNQLTFQPTDLPLTVDLDAYEHAFKPRRYSSAMFIFKGTRRENVVLMLKNKLENDIPLGANIETAEGQVFGLAGQANQIFLESIALLKDGTIIRWGKKDHQQCRLDDIDLTQFSKNSDQLQLLEVTCHS